MAILFHSRTERRSALSTRSIVGRSPACTVHIPTSVVSGEHASLRWTGGGWWIRDLGSRNGTTVDGTALTGGQEHRIVQGTTLCFGDVADPWIVEDAGPPGIVAVCLDQPGVAQPAGGILLLPNGEEPQAALIGHVDGTWISDQEPDKPVEDGQIIQVAGHRWRVHLPTQVEPTVDARPRPVEVRFRVSLDEEYVEVEVDDGDSQTRLRPRSFNYLLLTLARLRLDEAHLPQSSRGWVDQDDLAARLRLEPRTINVQLYRARQALGQVRVDLATTLVERRSRTGQLRFGLDTVVVQRI